MTMHLVPKPTPDMGQQNDTRRCVWSGWAFVESIAPRVFVSRRGSRYMYIVVCLHGFDLFWSHGSMIAPPSRPQWRTCFCLCVCFAISEHRPSRNDLSILVAHNDDPTGTVLDISYCFMCPYISSPRCLSFNSRWLRFEHLHTQPFLTQPSHIRTPPSSGHLGWVVTIVSLIKYIFVVFYVTDISSLKVSR